MWSRGSQSPRLRASGSDRQEPGVRGRGSGSAPAFVSYPSGCGDQRDVAVNRPGPGGKPDDGLRAPSLGHQVEGPVVLGNHSANDVKPESGAREAAAVVTTGVKNPVELGRRKAGPSVDHRYLDRRPRRDQFHLNQPVRMAQGVVDEIRNGLVDHEGVDLGDHRLRGKLRSQPLRPILPCLVDERLAAARSEETRTAH